MAKFSINLLNLRRAENELNRAAGKLIKAAEGIQAVSGSYIFSNNNALKHLQSRLKGTSGHVQTLGQKAERLGSALEEIAAAYEQAERAVLDNGIQDEGIKKALSGAMGGLIGSFKALFGFVPGGRYSPDPVNLCTGNYVYERRLMSQEGIAEFEWSLFYNSMNMEEGLLGRGWTSNLEIRLEVISEMQLCMHTYDAETLLFERSQGEIYSSLQGNAGSIVKTKTGYLYFDEEKHYLFAQEGRLVLSSDRNANGMEYLYGKDGRISGLLSTSGILLECSWEDGKLAGLSDSGRGVKLAYREGQLAQILDEEGRCTTYEYDEAGLLAKLVNPRGTVSLINEYDEKSSRYDDENGKVIYTEQNGNQVVYVHDEHFNNTQTFYADGMEKSVFNSRGRKVSFQDKRDGKTLYDYDGNGNPSMFRNASGDEVEVEYNRNHQPFRIKLNHNQIYEISYDAAGNPLAWKDADGRTGSYEYNDKGQIVRAVQADGSELRAGYDRKGNLTELLNPMGSRECYIYDIYNRVTACIDGNGNRTEFTYYLDNRVKTIKNPLGFEQHYRYDECGNLIEVRDYDGSQIKMDYNAINKLASYTDQNGNSTRYEYDRMWNPIRRLDANQGITEYIYDEYSRLIGIKDPLGNTITCRRDANGNIISRMTASGEEYKLEYDGQNRPVKIIRPDGTALQAAYDALGRVIRVEDSGKTTCYEYNFNGNLLAVTEPSGYRREQEYDGMGNLTEVRDRDGWLARYEYFPGGLLKKEQHPDGSFMEYFYDPNQNIISRKNQDGFIWKYSYDCLNRLVRTETEAGILESYEYDVAGNLIILTDGEGNRTEYSYSPTGKVTSMTDALGNRTIYEYNCMDQLIGISQPIYGVGEAERIKSLNRLKDGCHIYVIERDLMGNIVSQKDAMGNTVHYLYDPGNRLSEVIDEDGFSTRFEYEYDGLVKEICYANERKVHFSYDPGRHLKEMQDWNGLTKYGRDCMGRLKTVTDPAGNVIRYQYNDRGQRTFMQYPDGMEAVYEYNEKAQLTGLAVENERTEYTYHPNGLLEGKRYPDGTRHAYEYNGQGMVVAERLTEPGGNACLNSYAYDRQNRKIGMVSLAEKGEREEYVYSYNPVGSLISVCKNGCQIRKYEYDAFGNRTRERRDGIQYENIYNAVNQMTESRGPEGARKFSYDGRGNLVRETLGDRVLRQFCFGTDGMLEKASSAKGTSVYAYNGLRQRIGQTILKDRGGREAFQFLYDTAEETRSRMIMMNNGTEACDFVWDSELIMERRGRRDSFYINDMLGSPIEKRQESQLIKNQYDIFGFTTGIHKNTVEVGFAGYSTDPFTGLYHAGEREYEPEQGRFISKDPVVPGCITPIAFNPYLYTRNDPLNRRDPDGRFPVQLAAGIIGAVANVVTKVVTNVVSGEKTTWEEVAGSALGGFTGGFLLTCGIPPTMAPTIAGAVSSAVETGFTGVSKKLSGTDTESSWGDIAFGTVKSAVTGGVSGAAFGKAPSWLKIPGVTSGRGSWGSVWSQLVTKAQKGMISNITLKSLMKGLGYQSLVGITKGIRSGVKKQLDHAKDYVAGHVESWLSNVTGWNRGSEGAFCPLGA